MKSSWDCFIIGGGAAGMSAALVLGRARRRTLVIDAGDQSNLPAHGIGGLLGHDGRSPAELYAAGREELTAYPTLEVRSGEVVSGRPGDDGFVLELAGGEQQTARRVLLAMGMDYRYPHVPGIRERWGRSVFHCPFCHGWEVRDQPLGVLDRGELGMHRALLLRYWSDDVTLFANGPAGLEAADAERLQLAGVDVEERPVAGLHGPDDTLTAVVFSDGEERRCTGLLVPAPLHQRSALAEQLGATFEPPGVVAAEAIGVDPMYQTSASGAFAAGDVSSQRPSVANAIAAGSNAAAAVVHSLMADDYGLRPAGVGAGAATASHGDGVR